VTNPEILQLIGSGAILAMGLLLYQIAAGDWYCRYGREALLCAATYLIAAVVARMLTFFEVISQTDARVINGLLAVAFLFILVQIIWLHRTWHRVKEEP
jgi:Na+-transporting NADH:ubiquinone oxidoreductase subunit NqrD